MPTKAATLESTKRAAPSLSPGTTASACVSTGTSGKKRSDSLPRGWYPTLAIVS